MKCTKPISAQKTVSGTRISYQYRCGQCMSCRITKRQEWAGRILLESKLHQASSFITLTYSPTHLPPGGNLDPDGLTTFFKRLRKIVAAKYPQQLNEDGNYVDKTFRFFACGEYGDKFKRAHYHAVLFGLESCSTLEDYVARAWSKPKNRRDNNPSPIGYVKVSPLSPERAVYVARYTTKKLSEENRTDGRISEFARMSRNPGIGAGMADAFISQFKKLGLIDEHSEKVAEDFQISTRGVFRTHGRYFPISRYFINKIAESFQFNDGPYCELSMLDYLANERKRELHETLRISTYTSKLREAEKIKESEALADKIIRRDRIKNGPQI